MLHEVCAAWSIQRKTITGNNLIVWPKFRPPERRLPFFPVQWNPDLGMALVP